MVAFIAFTTDNQQINHTRAIYNLLDFLGDIGGLFDCLKVISWAIIRFTTPFSISNFIATKLFFSNIANNPFKDEKIQLRHTEIAVKHT